MAKRIQIRNVPDSVHRRLKARAALDGMSLSEYLLRELNWLAEIPTAQEMRDRLARLERVDIPFSSADLVRAERDAR